MRKFLWVVFCVQILFGATPAGAREPLSGAAAGQRVDTDPYALINEVNALRAANGLAAYAISPILMSVAQAHANYMAASGVVSHTGVGGTTSAQRILAAGYPLAGDLSLGGLRSENITAGRDKSVQQAVLEWQGDAPHLNTMLAAYLTEIGAGVAFVGEYVYYVIDCATPTSSGLPQAYTPAPSAAQVPEQSYVAPLASTILPSTPGLDGKLIHVVKPGETLWLIAISYGTKIADIRRLNNMTETEAIYPGEKLIIREEVTPVPVVLSTATRTSTPEITAATWTSPPVTVVPVAPTVITLTEIPFETAPVSEAPVASNSSLLVLGAIITAALVLALVFVRAGRKL